MQVPASLHRALTLRLRVSSKCAHGRTVGPNLGRAMRVLIIGMSGTGKSTVVQAVGERGRRAVDTDSDRWSHWVEESDGSADWVWREEEMTTLLTEHRHGKLFVSGCKTNQPKFYPLFDHVVLLSAPAQLLLARIANRTTNPYGKAPEEARPDPGAPAARRAASAQFRHRRDRRLRTGR